MRLMSPHEEELCKNSAEGKDILRIWISEASLETFQVDLWNVGKTQALAGY